MTQFPPSQPPPGGSSPNPGEAGWHPDPAGRHQHRYWDGVQWTDHVADGGVETVDPFAGAPQGPAAPPQPHYGGPGGSPYGGEAPYGGAPYGGGPPQPPAGGRPPRSGPSPGLLVAVGALLLALVVGVVVVLAGGDDDGDETTTDTTTETTDTTGGEPSDDALVDALALGVEQTANGAITEDQAVCVAEQMIATLGRDRIIEISQQGGDAFANLTSDEQTEVTQGMLECVDAETLAEIGGGN